MDITYKGLSLGDDTHYIATSIDGWESRPEITNGSTPHPRRLGSRVGGLSAVKRVVSIDFEIVGDAESSNLTTLPKYRLQQVMGLDDGESPLLIDLEYDSAPEIIFARVTAFTMPTVRNYGRRAQAFIEWTATDPRKYSVNESRATTGLPVALRGIPYPITYGRYADMITPDNRGEAIVQNIGNSHSPATYRIVGPVSNPTITVETGRKGATRRIQFNVNLVSGEVLTATSTDGSVFVGGARRQGITSGALLEDMEVPPGTSTVALGGTGGSSASLSVSWRDANL